MSSGPSKPTPRYLSVPERQSPLEVPLKEEVIDRLVDLSSVPPLWSGEFYQFFLDLQSRLGFDSDSDCDSDQGYRVFLF